MNNQEAQKTSYLKLDRSHQLGNLASELAAQEVFGIETKRLEIAAIVEQWSRELLKLSGLLQTY